MFKVKNNEINDNKIIIKEYENGKYEVQMKNDKREGKGIIYYNSGDREIGDYLNGQKIGKHVFFSIQGEVSIKNYT